MLARSDAARDLQIHGGFAAAQRVFVQQRFCDTLGLRVGRAGDLRRGQAVPQPLPVRVGAKKVALVRAHDFIDAVAEEEAAVIRRNARLVLGQVAAIEMDNHRWD